MNQKKLFFYLSLLAALFITACSDTEEPTEIDLPREAKTLLILNEGSWGQNNSTLARYDLETGDLDPDYFRSVNQRGLGDVGNDMIQYGTKIYIAVNGSSTIEVVEAATGKSIRQIPMETESGQAKQPRRVAAYDGKIYVTSFDDTVTRIDTASLVIDGSVTVGQDPEGIAVKGGKIYVANSGGLNWANGYDNTLSVIDVITFTEEKKIEVGTNPGTVHADSQGDVYVAVTGNYANIPGALKRIDAATGEVTTVEGIEAPGKFVIFDNRAYIISGPAGEANRVIVYDCLNEKIITENFFTDGSEIQIMYNISVDALSGDLFITETDYITPGKLHCFDKNGLRKFTLYALSNNSVIGMNPSVVIAM